MAQYLPYTVFRFGGVTTIRNLISTLRDREEAAAPSASSDRRTVSLRHFDCPHRGNFLVRLPTATQSLKCRASNRFLFMWGEPYMGLPSISVVVPALNEARNIPHVFERIPADVHEVILVDGNSVDETVAVARQLRPDVLVIMQTRRGKGNALACGVAAASGDIVALVDADGSADPGEIPRFVDALLNGADFAKGTRFAEGGGSSDITRLRSYGNYFLTAFFNACYGRKYSDLCYGFNVFWRRHAAVLGLDATSSSGSVGNGRLRGDGFEIETLIHVRVAKAGLVVAEVPSFEYPRIHGVSNLNALRDGRRVLHTILSERGLSGRQAPAVGAEVGLELVARNIRMEPADTTPPLPTLTSELEMADGVKAISTRGTHIGTGDRSSTQP